MHRFARCLLALLTATAAPAQQVLAPANDAHGPILATKDGMVLPAGEFTVVELLDAAARFLCRNYLYDLSTVERLAGFTLQRPLALDALGSEEVLAALLATRDLAALPIDELRGLYEVISLHGDGARPTLGAVPWRNPHEILRRPRLHELVNTAVELQHADAAQLANALRTQYSLHGMWRPGMPTAAAAGPRLLLLHGYRDHVAAVLFAALQVDQLVEPAPVSSGTADAAALRDLQQRLLALEHEVAALRAELAERRTRQR